MVFQGKLKTKHGLKFTVYYDHEDVPRETLVFSSVDLATFGEGGVFGEGTSDQYRLIESVRIQPRFQRCTAIAISVQEWYPYDVVPEDSLTWFGVRLELGLKKGSYKFDESQAATSCLGR